VVAERAAGQALRSFRGADFQGFAQGQKRFKPPGRRWPLPDYRHAGGGAMKSSTCADWMVRKAKGFIEVYGLAHRMEMYPYVSSVGLLSCCNVVNTKEGKFT